MFKPPFLFERFGKNLTRMDIDWGHPFILFGIILTIALVLTGAITGGVSAHRNGVCKETYGEALYSIEREDKEGNYKVFCKKDGMEKPFPESKE